METKLTKEELLEQLSEIEEKEIQLKRELRYQTYKDLSFFQIWEKSINWKSLIILIITLELFIFIFDSGNSVYILSALPIIYVLATISIPLQIHNFIKNMKKEKGE